MRTTILFLALLAAAPVTPEAPGLAAQGVVGGSIAGTVRVSDGTVPDGTHVTVVNRSTGLVVRTDVRHGRFFVQGLPFGGPYEITLERLGLHPVQREGVILPLGEPVEVHVEMQPAAIPIGPIDVPATSFPRENIHGGTATTVPDRLLHRLPTLNRNLYDFVRLAPQVSTRVGFAPGGMSGGGVGFRLNSFFLDGAPLGDPVHNWPPSLPLEAVGGYQVLVAPFDVRHGDFAGSSVNAVSRSGTNETEGSVFVDARNDALARRGAFGGLDPYERRHYGASVGGPLRRDRMHFFLASESQRLTAPAPGPFVGQPPSAAWAVPVAEGDLARLGEIMTGFGLEAGSGEAVANSLRVERLFGRLDATAPEWNSRAVVSVSGTRIRSRTFARPDTGVFPLSSFVTTQHGMARQASFQLHTGLRRRGGGHNELLISGRWGGTDFSPRVHQPIVQVILPARTGGAITVVSGTPPPAQGVSLAHQATTVGNTLTLPLGASHEATVGFQVERLRLERAGLVNAYGTWTFASLDSLEAGVARSFQAARDLGSAGVPLTATHYAAHAGNRWRASDRVTVTAGLRAEVLDVDGRPPYNPVVDLVFGRRTDQTLGRKVHLSPRVGFTWDASGAGRDRVRGGAGIFTGRPPLNWIHAAHWLHGSGTALLRCGGGPSDLGPAPPFDPDPRAPPAACGDGSVPPHGAVNLLDPRLQMAQTLRGVMAYDRRLPGGLRGTVEVLATRNLSDFVFRNLNLGEPQGLDPRGRVLYGTLEGSGLARPAVRDSTFPSVFELGTTSRNRSYQVSGRLEREFTDGLWGAASYTYTRVRDLQTPLLTRVDWFDNWSARAEAGRHEDLRPGISLNDLPHRVVVAGTFRVPGLPGGTTLSFFYVGESGSPFTYVAWGAGGRGDLNADGSNTNDPIYVPHDAHDPDQIRFTGHSGEPGADNSPPAQEERVRRQQAAFEAFIERAPCLRRHRGRILGPNACREPWSHTTAASVRQALPLAGRTLEVQLDLFNVLNLFRSGWGHRRVADPRLLEHVGQRWEPPGESIPVFRFDDERPRWTAVPAESAFQLQLGLRYRF